MSERMIITGCDWQPIDNKLNELIDSLKQKNNASPGENTGTHQQDTNTQQQDTGTQQQDTGTHQQDTNTQQQDTNTQQQDTNTQQQDTSDTAGSEQNGETVNSVEEISDAKLLRDYFLDSSAKSTNRPLNLGMFTDTEKSSEKKLVLKCSTFIGAVPLIKREDKSVEDDIVLMVSSRFNLSPIDMINTVLDSEEYWNDPDIFQYKNYTADEWKNGLNINTYGAKEKILFGQIDGFPLIDLSSSEENDPNAPKGFALADAVGLFETIDFIKKAKDICKKSIMKKTQVVEENLICKVKGRIVLNKQIKFNLSKGLNYKCYCSYNKMIDNNKENQILKYALYLCQKSENIPEVLKEDINTCMMALSGVALKKCTLSDFAGLKNNSAYRQYKDALETAKKIISRFSLNYNEKTGKDQVSTGNYKVKPFFIDMNVLVELYCRAVIADVIARNNELKDLKLVSVNDSKKELFDNKDLDKIFMHEYIPDIIIEKVIKKENKPFIVLDAKNSDVENQSSDSRRSRTHQVNFYMNALNVNIGGLMSPAEKTKKYLSTGILGLDKKTLVFIPLNTSIDGINEIPEYLKDKKEEDKLNIKIWHRMVVDNFLLEKTKETNTNNKKGKGDK